MVKLMYAEMVARKEREKEMTDKVLNRRMNLVLVALLFLCMEHSVSFFGID